MHIIIGTDHAGVALKDHLAATLRVDGHDVTDVGVFEPTSVDYPDITDQVARAVQAGRAERGVLVCGSGIGVAMRANRFRGVRAVVVRTPYDAEMSREHNNANVACFGARVTEPATADALLRQWLMTPFSGGRHQPRVAKIDGEVL